jgi:endonuclease I
VPMYHFFTSIPILSGWPNGSALSSSGHSSMVKFQKLKKNLKHNHRSDKTFRRIRSDIYSLKPTVLQISKIC